MDELFADKVLKALFKNKHAPWTLGTIENMTGTQRLINARKFVIDEQIAISGSSVGLDALMTNKFGKLTALCKAPYPRMWLEYETNHPTGQRGDSTVGILIDAQPRSMVLEYVVQLHELEYRPTVMPVIIVVGINPEHPIKIDTLGKGYKSIIVNEATDPKRVHIMENIFMRYMGEPRLEDKTCEMVSKLVIATLGILSLVNVVPTQIQDHKRRSGHRILGGQLRPYFDSSTVTITLPARKVTKFFGQALKDPKFRMRRHEVRGHFRHLLNKDGTLKKRLWVEHHDRGDASLGWVRHSTYSVEGKAGVTLPKVAYQTPTEN